MAAMEGTLPMSRCDLVHAVGRIVNMLGVGIHAGQRRDRAHEHRHGMRRVAETLHELLGGFVQHGVVGDVVHPVVQLFLGGQFAEQQQVGDFQEGAALGENFDGISAIAQDALVAVDVGDGALARRRVHERRIVGHQPEIVGAGFDLPQIHGPDGAVVDRDGIGFVGAIIGDGECVLWHGNIPPYPRALSANYKIKHSRA